MSAREITELRKAGKLQEAYDLASLQLQATPEDLFLKRAMSWVLYEYIKACAASNDTTAVQTRLQELINLNLPKEDKMIFDNVGWQLGKVVFSMSKAEPVNISLIKPFFESVKRLHFTKPSEVYSYLLKAFHKALKNAHEYFDLVDWWDLQNLRAEDFRKEKLPTGKEMMSLAEQVYIAYAKRLLPITLPTGERDFEPERIQVFMPLLENVIEQHPEFQYPPYYKAKLLLANGDSENSLSSLLPFVRKKKNDFWAWDVLSEAFPNDEEKQIACYCRALQCHVSDEFLVNIRQRLARWLVARNRYLEAKYEIELLMKARMENGWRVPAEVEKWTKEAWFQVEPNKDNQELYREKASVAESLLYADVTEEEVIIEFVNTNKKIANFIRPDGNSGFFKYGRFIPELVVGDVVKVRWLGQYQQGLNKLLTLRLAHNSSIKANFLREISEELRIPIGSEFGFAGDVFVHPLLVKKYGLKNGESVKGVAMKTLNPIKKQWG